MPGRDGDADGPPIPSARILRSENEATCRLDAPVGLARLSSGPILVHGMDDDPDLPHPGERFLHFELVEDLGRGAFARVYLARQESLANRLVVLKVTTSPTDEPQKLARLQHTNVVPVYSVHNAGRLQAICMPYLGRVTLAGVVAHLNDRGRDRPATGRGLFDTVLGGRAAGPGGPTPRPALAESLDALDRLSFVDGVV